MPGSNSKSDTTQKIRILSPSVLAAVMVLPAACVVASPCRYNLTDLGTLPGYEHSRAWSINNNGQIVGEISNLNPVFACRAVLFDAAGDDNNIDLGTPGEGNSYAYSVNIKGQIVGGDDPNDFPFNWHATIFDANGGGNNIKLANGSCACSINDNGQIVGDMVNGSGFRRAAIFDVNDLNKNTLLGTIDGFDYSAAGSINNSGQIVGCAYIGPIPEQARAVRFDPSGQGNNIDLGTLGGEYSGAFSTNDHVFDPNGSGNNIDLGTVAGCNGSGASSINNRGQIVGQANNFPLASPLLAVLFDPTGGGNNIELNRLINPELGWSLYSASCINDNGWIVGWGTNPQGEPRSFLLKPQTSGDFEPDADVDLEDFAVFASAWKSKDGDINWNVFCDISCPEDGLVDELDLSVFCSNWLAQQ